MAQNIILKRSALSGKVPDTGSLNLGEIAINTYDGRAFIHKSGSTESIEHIVVTNSTTTGSITITQTGSFGELNVTNDINVSDSIYVTNDIVVGGDVDVVGAVTASFFVGDGSLLTGIDTSADTEIPANDWDYNLPDSGSLSDGNNQSTKYTVDFQAESYMGRPVGYQTFITNDRGTTEIIPGTDEIIFILNNQIVGRIDNGGIIGSTPIGTVSSSAQISALGFITSSNNISSLNAYTSSNDAKWHSIGGLTGSYLISLNGAVSSSSQLTSSYDERYVLSGSITQTTWDNIASKPGGIVSGSSQVLGGSGIISGSSQLTSSYDARYALSASYLTSLNGAISSSIQVLGGSGVISGSSQLPSGIISGSSQLTASYDTRYETIGRGIFSGSSQITGVLTPSNLSTTGQVSASVFVGGYLVPEAKFTVVSSKAMTFWPNTSFESVRFTTGGGVLIGHNGGTNDFGNKLDVSGSIRIWGTTTLTGSVMVVNGLTGSIAATNGVVSGSTQILNYGVFATTGSNTFRGTQTLSGSILPAIDNTYDLGSATYQWRDIYVSSGSLYIDGTKVLGSTNQELQITTDVGQSIKILEAGSDSIILQSADGDIQLKTSGGGNLLFDPTTGLIDVRGTLQIQDGYKVTSSGGNSIQFGNDLGITGSVSTTGNINGINLSTFSSSIAAQLSTIKTNTGSTNTRLDVIESKYATTGSNTFIGTQIITGSLYITSDLIVQGSSSLQNISASAVDIGTNTIYLNTDTPAVRFGGISVFDSGSTAGTGSLFWDSQNERWVYQKSSGSSYSGGMLISGPRNSGALGDEVGMPSNKLIMGMGGDHISSSNIYHNGTDTAFAGNLEVTGSTTLGTLNVTTINAGNGVVSGSSQVLDILSSLNAYTSSNDTLNSLQTTRIDQLSSFTSSINTTIKNKLDIDGVVSGSSQIIGILSSLNTYTGSNDTTNSTQTDRLNQLSTASGSAINRLSALEIETANLETFSSSALTRLSTLEIETANLETFSSSALTRLSTLEVETANLETFSSSALTRLSTLEVETANLESFTSSINTIIKTQLNVNTVVSGSSQVAIASTNGFGTYINQAVLSTSSPTFESITATGTTAATIVARNTTANSNTNVQLGNNSVTNGAGIALFGSSFSTSGQYRASGAYVYSNQAGGMTIHAEGANSMFLSTNGTTAVTINSSQNVTFAGTITENSSIRYKENVETIKYGLDKVLQMRGVTYDKKDNGVKEMGVIAEEVYEVLPEVVLKNEEGEIDSVSYGRIVGVLIEAIKDLKKEIEDLKENK